MRVALELGADVLLGAVGLGRLVGDREGLDVAELDGGLGGGRLGLDALREGRQAAGGGRLRY